MALIDNLAQISRTQLPICWVFERSWRRHLYACAPSERCNAARQEQQGGEENGQKGFRMSLYWRSAAGGGIGDGTRSSKGERFRRQITTVAALFAVPGRTLAEEILFTGYLAALGIENASGGTAGKMPGALRLAQTGANGIRAGAPSTRRGGCLHRVMTERVVRLAAPLASSTVCKGLQFRWWFVGISFARDLR
ncbi:MAG: hypothetical protein ACLTOI_10160 [Faecalibacterium sp.]